MHDKPSVNVVKLNKRLRRDVGRAIQDYNMIVEGDRVMVCLSGGKDSYSMLDILLCLQRNAPVNFELIAVNLDQKQPGFPAHVLPEYLQGLGIDYHIIEQDTYSIVKRVIPEGKTMCGLCSRLRRGILYGFAKQHGFTKIALGHHREDILETLFLNMFHGGRLSAMPPKLRSEDGAHIVIRPLAYCREKDIQRYAERQAYPIIPCTLCGSQDHLQRVAIKAMLGDWEKQTPGRIENIAQAIKHIVPSHLADTDAFDFRRLAAESDATTAQSQDTTAPNWLRPQEAVQQDSTQNKPMGVVHR